METVEAQPSAAPFHDWNERITQECYKAVVAARIPGQGGRIADIVNTLDFMSFNFGPTLLEWMQGAAPHTYREILRADARSVISTGGYGNAIAQAYHHTILPLASRRDKVSEVRWGIADFRKRFGRDPVGMWVPETAVDSMTLDVLAQEGIAFTIVAPHQVRVVPPHGLPGRYRTSGGRSLALFVYDGPLSHGVAFGSLLQDAGVWAEHMAGMAGSGAEIPGRVGQSALPAGGPAQPARLVSIATDGETYGHHHRFGEMALAAVFNLLRRDPRVKVENFASFLSRNPAGFDVELIEPSSWSCIHGVERWRSECGCRMDPAVETQQEWRVGLRTAMDWLAEQVHRVYESEAPSFFTDPWAARDRNGPWSEPETGDVRALELLEMERQALRLFTSCGWFFDDMARIEPLQILKYAARALELAGPGKEEIEAGFLQRLSAAFSNEAPPRSGQTIFLEDAKPMVPAHFRVAGGAALWEAIAGPLYRSPVGGNSDQDRTDGAEVEAQRPGVAGFEVRGSKPNSFLVTHRRTLRQWEVETRIRRPSSKKGAVGVRLWGDQNEFIPLEFREIPEGFRLPIQDRLTREIPDLQGAMLAAIEDLEKKGAGGVGRVRDLADLHMLLGLPIPFDAQTEFLRVLRCASPRLFQHIVILREPLGFTPTP
jgi:hypothetical protein